MNDMTCSFCQGELLIMGFTSNITHTQCAGNDRVRFSFQGNVITQNNLHWIEFYVLHPSNNMPYYFGLNPNKNKMEVTYYNIGTLDNHSYSLYEGEYDKDIRPDNALQYLERLLNMKAFL